MREITELRKAVFQRLRSNVNVPVFDSIVPASASFPCVRYSFLELREWPSFLTPSGFMNTLLVIEVFSKAPTMTEADAVLKQAVEAIDRWSVEIAGFRVGFGLISTNRRFEPDDQLWIASAECSVHVTTA